MEQNPAYRFAADTPLPVKREGLFVLVERVVDVVKVIKVTLSYYYNYYNIYNNYNF